MWKQKLIEEERDSFVIYNTAGKPSNLDDNDETAKQEPIIDGAAANLSNQYHKEETAKREPMRDPRAIFDSDDGVERLSSSENGNENDATWNREQTEELQDSIAIDNATVKQSVPHGNEKTAKREPSDDPRAIFDSDDDDDDEVQHAGSESGNYKSVMCSQEQMEERQDCIVTDDAAVWLSNPDGSEETAKQKSSEATLPLSAMTSPLETRKNFMLISVPSVGFVKLTWDLGHLGIRPKAPRKDESFFVSKR